MSHFEEAVRLAAEAAVPNHPAAQFKTVQSWHHYLQALSEQVRPVDPVADAERIAKIERAAYDRGVAQADARLSGLREDYNRSVQRAEEYYVRLSHAKALISAIRHRVQGAVRGSVAYDVGRMIAQAEADKRLEVKVSPRTPEIWTEEQGKLDEIRLLLQAPLSHPRGGMDASVLAQEILEVLDRD